MDTPDLLQFYAVHFRPGAIDLSASCPSPMPIEGLDLGALEGGELEFVPPSGAPELRAAIAGRYRKVEADEILIASGASEALAAIAFATLDHHVRAWAAPGAYPSFTKAAAKVGATVTSGGAIPVGATVALASNPTVQEGRIVDVGRFIGECAVTGAIPVMDEVYRDLHLGGPLPAAADHCESAVSIGDLSKPLGLGGLRIGWVATRDAVLRERIDRELQLLSGGPSSLSAAAAVRAFECFDDFVAETMATASRHLPQTTRVLEARGWNVVQPEAGLTLLAAPPRPLTPNDYRRLDDAGYFLLPGEAIGAPGSVRITLMRAPEVIASALDVLEPLAG